MSRTVRFEPYFNEKLGRYCIYIPPWLSETGKPARLYFRDRNDAQVAANRLKTRHKTFGTSLTSLSPVRLGEAAEAYSLLDQTQRPFSLLALVRAHIAREDQRNKSVPFYDLVMTYVDLHSHHSVMHKEQTLSLLRRFKPIWEKQVSEIETDRLQKILEPLAASTRNRYLRTLSALWNFAIKKDYTKENPISKMDRIHLPKKSIETFSNKVIQGMLNEALESNIALVPFFALGAFAGLRAGSPEMTRLRWDDIRFDEKVIIVRPEIAKTRQKRFVDMSDNLIAWLKVYLERVPKHPKRVITLSFQLMQKARSEVFHRVAGKNAEYIQAGLRHTFASNHLAQHGNIDNLVMQLGHHDSPQMLWKHYHLHTRKEDAQAFWSIMPPQA